MKTLMGFRVPGSRFNEKIHSDNPELGTDQFRLYFGECILVFGIILGGGLSLKSET
jgi:hypothetical protein